MKQRTDADRFEFVCRLRLAVEYVYDIDGNLEYICICSGFLKVNVCYCGKEEGFTSFKRAVDYIMDMDQLGKEGYFDR